MCIYIQTLSNPNTTLPYSFISQNIEWDCVPVEEITAYERAQNWTSVPSLIDQQDPIDRTIIKGLFIKTRDVAKRWRSMTKNRKQKWEKELESYASNLGVQIKEISIYRESGYEYADRPQQFLPSADESINIISYSDLMKIETEYFRDFQKVQTNPQENKSMEIENQLLRQQVSDLHNKISILEKDNHDLTEKCSALQDDVASDKSKRTFYILIHSLADALSELLEADEQRKAKNNSSYRPNKYRTLGAIYPGYVKESTGNSAGLTAYLVDRGIRLGPDAITKHLKESSR